MNIQRIHCEIIRVHVKVFKHLLQGDLFSILLHHHSICLCFTCVLDKPEKVLLVHAGCCMDVGVYLNIMKVTFNLFLRKIQIL